MIPTSQPTGLLLIGHGTRHAAGQGEFRAAAELVRRRLPEMPVELAFLELCEPTVDAAVARLADAGVERIVAVPVLLLAAAHAREDIPQQLAAAGARFPHVTLKQAPHLGCHNALVRLSEQRFDEALAQSGASRAADTSSTALLIVGRGTSDAEAIAELHRFVELRVARTPVAHVLTCFLAVARPSLDEAIEQIAATNVVQIVVQPHLLFQGDLLDRLRDAVAAARQRHAAKHWRLAAHLGPDTLLVDAILGRIAEVA
jgi:sirohydrochlorin cobaltochelatase